MEPSYDMRISDWSSDVCSSDLDVRLIQPGASKDQVRLKLGNPHFSEGLFAVDQWNYILGLPSATGSGLLSCQYQVQFDKQHKVKATYWNTDECSAAAAAPDDVAARSEEHTYELQSLMRIPYAVFCLKK